MEEDVFILGRTLFPLRKKNYKNYGFLRKMFKLDLTELYANIYLVVRHALLNIDKTCIAACIDNRDVIS